MAVDSRRGAAAGGGGEGAVAAGGGGDDDGDPFLASLLASAPGGLNSRRVQHPVDCEATRLGINEDCWTAAVPPVMVGMWEAVVPPHALWCDW